MTVFKKLIEAEQEAQAFGFIWSNPKQIIEQIKSECNEVSELLNADEVSQQNLQEEIGDLVHAVFSLCLFSKLDPEETLELSINKFAKRLAVVREIAHEKGLADLKSQPLSLLMSLWDLAKERLAEI